MSTPIAVARGGQADRDAAVATRHVEHGGDLLRVEHAPHDAHVVVDHRRAGRPPEIGGQAAVEVDVPLVRHRGTSSRCVPVSSANVKGTSA
jgi:hypothetical protein